MTRTARSSVLVLISLSAILVAPRALAQDLSFGPELGVDPPIDVVAAGPGARALFEISTGYLLLGTNNEAIRLNPDGTRLDPAPSRLANPGAEVTCAPSQCLAVRWSPGVSIQRVQHDGTPIDPAPVFISSGGISARAVWSGDRYLVAWVQTVDADTDLHFLHVRADGTQVESAPVRVPLTGNQSLYAASCGASSCLLVYRDPVGTTPSVRALRVAHDGTVLDPAGGVVVTSASSVSTVRAVNGGAYDLIYWRMSIGTAYAARVSADGALVDATPMPIGSFHSSGVGPAVCLATGCLIGCRPASGSIGLIHVAFDGGGRLAALTAGGYDTPVVACGAAGCRAAFAETSTNRLTTVAVTSTGAPTGPAIQPVLRGNAQEEPWIIAGPTDFLVAWRDERVAPAEVRVARMGPAGPLSADSVAVTTATRANPGRIVGAYGGGTHVVAWSDTNLLVRRVLADGSLPDATPISLGGVTNTHQVAFDGRSFLFAWRAATPVLGRRMSPIGATLEPSPFEINPVGSDPAVASDGTGSMVMWAEQRGTRVAEIYGRRISGDGAILDALAFPVASADEDQESPSLTYGGGQYLAVWRDQRFAASGGPWAIYGARVMPDGTVLDLVSIPIRTTETQFVQRPRAAWNGTSFIVTWEEAVSIEDPPGSGAMRDAYYVVAARVAPDGAVLDTVPARVAELGASWDRATPAIAALADGTTMLVYARVDDTPTVRAMRVFARVVSSGARPGMTCAAPADCASGACIDGICCERACDSPCEACTLAGGAPADGTCAPRPAGAICRAASSAACDVDEVCDGVAASCPADLPMPGCIDTDGGIPEIDASVATDAGADASTEGRDAGSELDAGSSTPPSSGGCASAAGSGDGHLGWIALSLVVVTRLRRRRSKG